MNFEKCQPPPRNTSNGKRPAAFALNASRSLIVKVKMPVNYLSTYQVYSIF